MSKTEAKPTPDVICADCDRVIDIDGGEQAYTCERCGKDPICAECGGDDANPGRVVCEDCAVSEEDLSRQAVDIYCETNLTPRELAEHLTELRRRARAVIDKFDPDRQCIYDFARDEIEAVRAILAKTDPK